MTDPEKQYYETMNWLMAPIRQFRSFIQTAFIILGLIGVGLAYPILVYANHEPLTFAVFAVPLLVLLALFTLFYAPYYLVLGGMAFLIGWGAWIINFDAPDRTQTLLIWFAFLSVGIFQSYLRRLRKAALEDKPEPQSFQQQINQSHLEKQTRQYDAMSHEERAAMTRLISDNFLIWPDLQHYRTREADPSNLDLQTKQYTTLSEDERGDMASLFGDNFTIWPCLEQFRKLRDRK